MLTVKTPPFTELSALTINSWSRFVRVGGALACLPFSAMMFLADVGMVVRDENVLLTIDARQQRDVRCWN
jgi:hypothetical protein